MHISTDPPPFSILPFTQPTKDKEIPFNFNYFATTTSNEAHKTQNDMRRVGVLIISKEKRRRREEEKCHRQEHTLPLERGTLKRWVDRRHCRRRAPTSSSSASASCMIVCFFFFENFSNSKKIVETLTTTTSQNWNVGQDTKMWGVGVRKVRLNCFFLLLKLSR